jgi:DDE family transposase
MLDGSASGTAYVMTPLALLRQRIYQIVGGYEDANDAGRLRYDPLLQIVADQKLGEVGSHLTLTR